MYVEDRLKASQEFYVYVDYNVGYIWDGNLYKQRA